MEMGSPLKYQATGVTSQEGIYRAAFPAFRVFIFGQEVSGDVIEVRVNQSGGSMDRSPATCSISLANIADKYILDHNDMLALSNSRLQLVDTLKRTVGAYSGSAGSQKDDAGEDTNVVSEFMQLFSSGARFAEFGGIIDAFYDDLKTLGVDAGSWAEGKVPDQIKLRVINDKIWETIPNWGDFADALKEDVTKGTIYKNVLEGNYGARFIYPLTEGDCIFHPNDPIRIAFRDPFEPSVWYWMFSGFVDGFVEDRGANQESVVTITGTDVTKIARYSFFQLSVDAIRDKAMAALFPVFREVSAATSWQAYDNLFSKFSIFEMLELLFFGLDSYRGTLSNMTNLALLTMSDDEKNIYLQHTSSGMSLAEIEALEATKKTELVQTLMEGFKLQRFQGAEVPALSTPRGDVRFQRKDDQRGVYAIVIGAEAGALEEAMGAEVVGSENLRYINDQLHHRISTRDPEIMGVTPEAKSFKSPTMAIGDIIGQIGANFRQYPVGGGRVFYVAPSGFAMGTAAGVMNEVMAAAGGGLHSEFKDRLTFLYDVAEQVQFCFYATPRGDVVFEMPFYDFDPWQFDYQSSFVSNVSIADATAVVRQSLSEWSKGSKKYTESEVYNMMQLSSDLSLLSEGFTSANMQEKWAMDYAAYFTIDKHETFGFSNAVNDSGLKTMGRCTPGNIARGPQELQDRNSRNTQFVVAPELAALLGFRPASEKSAWTEVTTDEGAAIFAAMDLRRSNSEARSIGLQILPHFGLMVNRPLYWRQRNYVANIVSCQHSIAVNSSCDTQVNLNYARGWKGELSGGMEVFRHFGGDMPFSYAALLVAKSAHTEKQPAQDVPDPDAFPPNMWEVAGGYQTSPGDYDLPGGPEGGDPDDFDG